MRPRLLGLGAAGQPGLGERGQGGVACERLVDDPSVGVVEDRVRQLAELEMVPSRARCRAPREDGARGGRGGRTRTGRRCSARGASPTARRRTGAARSAGRAEPRRRGLRARRHTRPGRHRETAAHARRRRPAASGSPRTAARYASASAPSPCSHTGRVPACRVRARRPSDRRNPRSAADRSPGARRPRVRDPRGSRRHRRGRRHRPPRAAGAGVTEGADGRWRHRLVAR